MSHYKPYPAYKDSGVEWIGRVPSDWDTVPLGKLSTARCDGPFGSGLKSEHYVPAGVRVVRLQNIGSGRFRGEDAAYISIRYWQEELGGGHEVLNGDLLVAGLGDENNPLGRACVAPASIMPAIVKADCYRFRLVQEANPDFVALALSATAKAECGFLATGATRDRLNLTLASARKVPFPPTEDQARIVSALDRETARIDALIAKKTRFIELLKEKRQALITHAVTKGLDPSVKMKDSGVEWIGEVPEHWLVSPIRRAARLESGHTPSRSVPAYWENCTVPWFTLADIWQVRKGGRITIEKTSESVSELGLANSSARKLPAGTVVLSRTASVGFPAILGKEMATSQDFAAWVCGERLHNGYLYLCLRAMRDELSRLTMGSTHKTIYMPDIEDLRCPLPPLREQEQIADTIFHSVDRIERVANRVDHSIGLLKERRSALITAAVTGQIDMRSPTESRP